MSTIYSSLTHVRGIILVINDEANDAGDIIRFEQISLIASSFLRTGVASSIEGIARLIGRSDDPKLTVTFPSLPLPIDAPYWVLDSDYKSYAVVWSCTNFGVFK